LIPETNELLRGVSDMYEIKVHPVPTKFASESWVTKEQYEKMYRESLDSPDQFWGEMAEKFLTWEKRWASVDTSDLKTGKVEWFKGGVLNVTVNCIDRHLEQYGDQTAIIWEGDDPSVDKKITYRELSSHVNRFANLLKDKGVKKGDRVCIYMPMIPEAAYAMLACARVGAIHSVVFGGFSPEALKDRINDSTCSIVITADEGLRGGKKVALKKNVDEALEGVSCVNHVIVVRHTGSDVPFNAPVDTWYNDEVPHLSDECPPEPMDAEDPLFILYTSGSTGKPKGVLHTTGGYLLYAAITHKYTFDYKEGEVFWCTADIGWITGHSYIVYGPLANRAITLMFEGVPSYPDYSRFWQVCDKHNVSIFYTAPTAIRALMKEGEGPVKATSRKSIRLLGTVGEPINPEAWEWYYNVVGEQRAPIVDTWWQTETGGHMITPLPGATDLKPGSATFPFFGIEPAIFDTEGKEIPGEGEGLLVIKRSWPGQMRTVYGDHQRFIDTYLSAYPGVYFTGDGARRDKDGYLWITGRVDDVINVSGHRMGTAEVESALVLHDLVAEAAVVGFPHQIKGQGIYAYVTLVNGVDPSDALRKELIELVAKEIGPIAKPDAIQWAPGLPKTRSGKIMRRILRKIAAAEFDQLGDISTLADSHVVEDLKNNRIPAGE